MTSDLIGRGSVATKTLTFASIPFKSKQTLAKASETMAVSSLDGVAMSLKLPGQSESLTWLGWPVTQCSTVLVIIV